MRKLPALATARHIYASIFNNLGAILYISWGWMLVFLVASGVAWWFMPVIPPGIDPRTLPQNELLTGALLQIISGIILILGITSIAVNWHRYILIDDLPKGSKFFRLDSLTWRYFGNAIFIGLITAVIIFLPVFILGFMLASSLSPVSDINQFNISTFFWGPGIIFTIAFSVLILLVSVYTYRLSIKLPAIALGNRDFTLGNARAVSAGNFWPILVVAACIEIPLTVISFLLQNSIPALNPSSAGGFLMLFIMMAVGVVFQVFAFMTRVTMLTTFYGFFVEGRDV